ncbi:MAG: hypothetical protein JSS87_14850 [Acidobacteria bacterium]|nr:hypothetical protein [Acidobacteriota bacterium]
MEISLHALMNVMHGLLFGGFFLMVAWGGLMALVRSSYEEVPSRLTPGGYRWEHGYWTTAAALGWAAVLSGAYMVYPWYRATPPAGTTDLTTFAKAKLLSDPRTVYWHTIGMEWKEHVAFFAPIAITLVAYLVWRYRGDLRHFPQVRRAATVFATVALFATLVAGFFGAMLDKAAPMQGGRNITFFRSAK